MTENKAFIDEYIRLHYDEMKRKFEALSDKINSRYLTALDILNETMLSFYSLKETFADYGAFEQYADRVFRRGIDTINKR